MLSWLPITFLFVFDLLTVTTASSSSSSSSSTTRPPPPPSSSSHGINHDKISSRQLPSSTRQPLDFQSWKNQFDKVYVTVEEEYLRRTIYEANLQRWSHLNALMRGSAHFGPEKERYADLTPDEFVMTMSNCDEDNDDDDFKQDQESNRETAIGAIQTSRLRGRWHGATSNGKEAKEEEVNHRQLDFDQTLVSNIIASRTIMYVDWRNYYEDGKSYVTPVKDQGPFGTCWSFAASENLEGLNVRQGYALTNISEQEFVDCCPQCAHHKAEHVFEWLQNNTNGQPAIEEYYPYQGDKNLSCHASYSPRANVTVHGWGRIQDVDGSGRTILDGLQTYGPMGISVDSRCFHGYQSGIIRDCPLREGHNHAVLMVAAGTEIDDHHLEEHKSNQTTPPTTTIHFFTIKNSWGTKWGEDGYVRIEQGKDWWNDYHLVFSV